jgi:hypothetical protein
LVKSVGKCLTPWNARHPKIYKERVRVLVTQAQKLGAFSGDADAISARASFILLQNPSRPPHFFDTRSRAKHLRTWNLPAPCSFGCIPRNALFCSNGSAAAWGHQRHPNFTFLTSGLPRYLASTFTNTSGRWLGTFGTVLNGHIPLLV